MQNVSNLLEEHDKWEKDTIDFLKKLNDIDLNIVVSHFQILKISGDTIRAIDIIDGSSKVWTLENCPHNILEGILRGLENMFHVIKKIDN